MNLKTIIFDFDGTIADTKELINKIFIELSDQYKFTPFDLSNLEKYSSESYISVARRHGIPFYKMIPVLLKFRNLKSYKMLEAKVFEDIKSLILELGRDFKLIIVSSNSKSDIEAFLDKNKILLKFHEIYSNQNLFAKDKLLKHMIRKEQLNVDESIYIGDEVRDVLATKKVGMRIIAVTWGFNSYELLKASNPDFIVKDLSELKKTIYNLK